jgi:hypothetical protein
VSPNQFSEGWTRGLSFGSGLPRVLALITPLEEEWRLHSVEAAFNGPEMPFDILGVWVENNLLGLAINILPVVIEINLEVIPVRMQSQ